ncbi:MAG: protein-glutamate O-methyltransferase CheR [Spirochaetales bacterium]|nr:protein-glutamate O-methyltransferase CheR [Spirochaetales bacterium]
MENYLTDQEFKLYSSLIYEQSGIHFSSMNRSVLESRLKERLRNTNLANVSEYYQLIMQNPEEMKILLDTVTTNLTRFFRNTAHFNAFENYVIPALVEQKNKKKDTLLKVWSAGCSTGEEPYTVAMILKEKFPAYMNIEIIGSDISLKSLMTAKESFYSAQKVDKIPEKYLQKYFEKKRDGYQVKKEIQSMVHFDYHNLKYESGLKNIDVVFCRNVLIYFDSEAQESTVNRFYKAMTNFSFLFIGHSESLFGMKTPFKFLKTEWATLYQKNIGNHQET